MIEVISWSVWSIASVGALVLLWLYYNWTTYRQSDFGMKLIRRSIFYLIGLLGIALLILRPVVGEDKGDTTIAIFTDGSLPSEIETFEKRYPQGETYIDVNDYLSQADRSAVDTVHLYGTGLHPIQSSMLSEEEVRIHPMKKELDLVSIDIPDAREYNSFGISGKLTGEVTKAWLKNPQGEEIQLELDTDQRFDHEISGLAAGRYLYALGMESEEDAIVIELPVIVLPSQNYSVLVLLSAPSFEANYFKNYWSELGHSYAQRIKISNNRYTQIYINRSETDLVSIETNDLNNVDFIMSDATAWNALTDNERSRIKRKVSSNGVALFIISSAGQVGNSLPEITLSSVKDISYKNNDKEIKLSGSTISRGGWQKVKHSQIDIAYKRQYGIGHIGYLPIEDSYKMLLSDMGNEYKEYWASLLSSFYIDTNVPYIIDQPKYIWESDITPITIHTSSALSEHVLLNDSVSITWINNPLIPNSYKVEIQPTQGWNKLQIGNEDPYYFYAHPQGILNPAQHERNSKSLLSRDTNDRSVIAKVESRPISHWWGYALAMIGLGLLWLDERL